MSSRRQAQAASLPGVGQQPTLGALTRVDVTTQMLLALLPGADRLFRDAAERATTLMWTAIEASQAERDQAQRELADAQAEIATLRAALERVREALAEHAVLVGPLATAAGEALMVPVATVRAAIEGVEPS